MLSKKPPIKKIYLSIIIIAVIGFLWLNQGLSNEVLEVAVKNTMKTLKINNVTVGEDYIISHSLMAGINADIYRADVYRYNIISINITLYNPSDYRLQIRLERFDVLWISKKDVTSLLGGIEDIKIIIIESGESKTFEIEGLGFEGLCTNYLWRKIETPEFLFNTNMDVTTSAANGKAIQYYLYHNLDGSIKSEDYYYTYYL